MFISNFSKNAIRQYTSRIRPLSIATTSISNEKLTMSFTNGLSKRYNHDEVTVSSSSSFKEPSLEVAKSMNTCLKGMDNRSLVLLSRMDSPPCVDARAEVLKRHIMSVDEVEYGAACETFKKIETENMEFSLFITLPYKLGIFMGVGAGFASFPLCFDLGTAKWFNEHYVTTEVPGVEDLETILEVGSWAWNWMEPPLGQISFFLLCLQFSRAQIQNLGMKPYTAKLKAMRADRVCSKFSAYDRNTVTAYSESSGLR